MFSKCPFVCIIDKPTFYRTDKLTNGPIEYEKCNPRVKPHRVKPFFEFSPRVKPLRKGLNSKHFLENFSSSLAPLNGQGLNSGILFLSLAPIKKGLYSE